MAIDVYTSPRISFSRDIDELNSVPLENHNPLLIPTTTVDFDFCIGRDFADEISSADELFADGRILPVGIKQNTHRKNGVASGNKIPEKKRLIEFLSSGNEDDEMDQSPMPCWQIGRSSSAGRGNGLLRLLNRSKSTGSVPNPKPAGAIRKQSSLREGSVNSGCNRYYNYPYVNYNNVNTTSQRASSRKGSGFRVNPVLNILPAKGDYRPILVDEKN